MIDLSVDVRIDDIEKALGEFKEKTPEILKRAVNATAREVQKKLFHQAKETYVVKASAFKSKGKSLKLKRATVKNLEAHLQSEGGPLALYGFQVKANDASTYARAKKASSLKGLVVGGRWAFVAQMPKKLKNQSEQPPEVSAKGGHIGVFQRAGASRLPIHEFFSVSVPQMIGNEKEVYGKLEPEFEDILSEKVEQELKRFLSKQGG